MKIKIKNVLLCIKKEFMTIIKDKKFVKTIIFVPFLAPFMVLLYGFLEDYFMTANYRIGVNYELNNNEQSIVNELDLDVDFIMFNTLDDMSNAYETDEIRGYIYKEDNTYTLYYDSSQTDGSMVGSIMQSYLNAYNNYLANNYLISEDIDTDKVFKNINIEEELLNPSEDDSLMSSMLQSVISIIVMIITTICVSVITDSVVGEKERGTLETLLTFPISSKEIVVGKLLTSSIISSVSALFGLLLCMISINYTDKIFTSIDKINFSIPFNVLMISIFIIIIESVLVSAISIILSGKAKNFKEGQSKLSIISFVSIVPMYISMMGNHATPLISLIPIINSGVLLNDIFFNKIDYLNLGIMLISTIVYSVIFIIYISKQYTKEETLF